MKIRGLVVASIAVVTFCLPAFAGKPAGAGGGGGEGGGGGKGDKTTSSATVHSVNASAPEFPLYVGNDGNATYPVNFTDDIVIDAGFYGGGGKKSLRRGAAITLLEPAFGTTSRPFDQAVTPSHLVVRCGVHGVALGEIVPGNPGLCALLVTFDGGDGNSYRIAANGNSPNVPPGGQQGEFAQVECLEQDSALQCVRWRVTPSGTPTAFNGDPNPKSLSILLNHETNEVLGYYYTSFHIEASR